MNSNVPICKYPLFLVVVLLSLSSITTLCFQKADDEIDIYKGKWVSKIEFVGNAHFTSQELLDALNVPDNLAEKANLLLDYPYSKNRTQYYLNNKLRRYISGRGYFKASVEEPEIIPDGDSIKLVVPIQEGRLFHWGNLKIIGDSKVFSSKQIEDIIGYSKAKPASSKLIFDGVFEKLKAKYKEFGFLNFDAEIDPTFNSDNSVDLILSIDEGLPFKVKTIDFSKVISSQINSLKKIIPLKEGDIFRQSNLVKSIAKLNKLKKFYEIEEQNDVEIILGEKPEKDGYFGATVVFKVIPNEPIQKKFYLNSIKFIGNKNISDDELKKAFGFEVGSAYNLKFIKDFVKRIKAFNKSGKTRPILEDCIGVEIGEKGEQDNQTSDKLNFTILIRERN